MITAYTTLSLLGSSLCSLGLQLLAPILVAVNLPVLPLALHTAIVNLLAGTTHLVLKSVALGSLAAVAVLLRLTVHVRFRWCSVFLYLLEPGQRCVVLPGV